MKIEGINKLFGFEGFIIDKITFSPENVQSAIHRDQRRRMTCPHCGHQMTPNKSIHRTIYDLPLGTALCVKIDIETSQGKCTKCGHAKMLIF